ncbi:hypothetical protein Tco_1530408 [Tanacetum coccineum]
MKSAKKTIDTARHTRVERLVNDNKGVSDINKELYNGELDNGEVFMFRGRDHRDYEMQKIDTGQLVEEAWKIETKEKIDEYKNEVMRWELDAEKKMWNENERSIWMKARKIWVEKESIYTSMLRQKDRIRWDAEGDENLNNFHLYARRKNNMSNIRVRSIFCCQEIKKISRDEVTVLEREFSEMELWDAVREEISRGCKTSFVTIIPKAADPIGLRDFHPISLIGCYYKIILKILAERIKKVVVVEGLNATVNEVVDKDIFKGVRIGAIRVMVSHLRYADNTIFFGVVGNVERRAGWRIKGDGWIASGGGNGNGLKKLEGGDQWKWTL